MCIIHLLDLYYTLLRIRGSPGGVKTPETPKMARKPGFWPKMGVLGVPWGGAHRPPQGPPGGGSPAPKGGLDPQTAAGETPPWGVNLGISQWDTWQMARKPPKTPKMAYFRVFGPKWGFWGFLGVPLILAKSTVFGANRHPFHGPTQCNSKSVHNTSPRPIVYIFRPWGGKSVWGS